MSTENKITIKKWIENNASDAKKINNSAQEASAISQMSLGTGIPEIFIQQNLKQIKNWI